MPALEFGTAATGPPVLLVPDIFGPSPFYEYLARLLAAQGLHVVLPDYFFRLGPLAQLDHGQAFERRRSLNEIQSVEDLRAAVAWLRGGNADAPVGLVGFCMGATFVLDLASTEPDLVTVAYYGLPVPQASLVAPPTPPMDLVEDLRGPVLAFWGADDEAVGADNVCRYVAAAATANDHFEAYVLPGLGHGFLATADLSDPSDPATHTWERTINHLREHLAQEAR